MTKWGELLPPPKKNTLPNHIQNLTLPPKPTFHTTPRPPICKILKISMPTPL